MGLLLSPLTWLVLALAGGWMACRRDARMRILRAASVLLGVLALLAMTPLAANLLVGGLERGAATAAPDCLASPPTVAVVLGGAVDETTVELGGVTPGLTSRRRMERAVRWWQEAPGRKLVISGGPARPGGVPVSDLMMDAGLRAGVAPAAMRVEDASTSTWENARHVAGLGGVPKRVVLVTSSMQMPRARFAMRMAGFEVCPVPADRMQLRVYLPYALIPRSSALRKTEAALHEIIGLGWYRLRAVMEAAPTPARDQPQERR